ncbi:DUF885 domain-containing protein [Robiginitalea sp. SC105]|nr:DUF885 domain-containing protein [Robiginitalea sp. SC105]
MAISSILFSIGVRAQEGTSPLDSILHEVASFEAYDWSEYPLGLHTVERFRREADFATEMVGRIQGIDPSTLDETDRISLDLLRFSLQDEADQFRLGMHLNPIQADQGFHLNLNYRIRPLNNYKEVKSYLKMLRAFPDYADQHFELMREGLERGISQPRVIFEGYASTYEDHIVEDYQESDFYGPLRDLPAGLSPSQQDSVLDAGREAIETAVVPAFRSIREFFETEYLPATREAIGVSATPGGRAFYQNRIDFYTTIPGYTADSIHRIGLSEVARIRSEMQTIIDTVGFEGNFADFLDYLRTDPQFYAGSPEELLIHARDIAKRIDATLPRFFNTLPRRPYGVEPVPDAIAPKYTGGRYKPPSGPREAGTYLVNTYKLESRPLYTLPALTAHEAVPGHHLQGALNRELADSIPDFRRRLYLSAYGEGWGLYAEYLAAEMGIYRNGYEKFGQLTYEMWRACRLVVDTGIHALGWSREEAVDYMRRNTALSLHEINTETDRYIAWPGQALSYKMGEIILRKLRAEAENALGPDFDIGEFHEVILEQGTVTLPILMRRVRAYIEKNANP